jgi:hypothetical protein
MMGDMERGLPRPVNRDGLPVPYVAAAKDRLGKKNHGRAAEVTRNWLCQVCGEAVNEPAYAVMRTDGGEFGCPPDWVLDHGLLHEECLRLAVNNCPDLGRWRNRRLLCVRRQDVLLTKDLQLVVPVDRHEELEVPVERYRE